MFSQSAAAVGSDFRSDAYNGIESVQTGQMILLPQVLKGVVDVSRNKQYNSMIAIQNTNLATSANITVTYYVPHGSSYVRTGIIIPPSSSYYLDMTTETTIPPSAIPYGFNGSARITADQPVAVVVNQNAAGVLMTYTGFTPSDASQNLSVPLLLKNVADPAQGYTWGSALFVMAADGTSANVTITYTNNYNNHIFSQSVSANPAILLDLAGLGAGNAVPSESVYYGSAVLSTTNPAGIVAMVTQQTNLDSYRGSRALAYRASPMTAGTSALFVPTLLKNVVDTASGVNWHTGLTLQWQGTLSTTVTMTYTNAANGNAQIVKTIDLGPFVPSRVIDQGVDPLLSGANSVFYGSAVLTSSNGQPFIGIVNQLGDIYAPGDAAMSFRGVNR